jgi:co-chaperonin GroES (HSP10)
MKVTAVGHRVVVRPLKLEEADEAYAAARRMNLQISDITERKLQTGIDKGIVLEVGPTAFVALNPPDYPAWCKEGDTIAYARNAGKVIRLSDDVEDYVLVINDEDVVTVLKD